MKSRILKKAKVNPIHANGNLSTVLAKLLRFSARRSAYAFAATAGVWLPRADAATLVNLDATAAPYGPLTTWTNSGTVVSNFVAVVPTNSPSVVNAAGLRSVEFTGGAGGHYIGPIPPAAITGVGARTVEAWVHNPAVAGEEAIIAWGGRNTPAPGPVGENWSFGHGSNGDAAALGNGFGAVAMWGGPDIGWFNRELPNVWQYAVATYDGGVTRVYLDGAEVNSEGVAINTRVLATDGVTPYQMRIGRQNTPAGGIDATGAPTLRVARLRVHDVALDATTITNQYTMEKAELDAMIAQNLGDLDGDTMANYWEDLHGFNKNDPSDAPLDADSDGSTNAQEFARGTLPRDSDTDDDGYLDGVESNTGTFVSVSDTGTNPLLTDTDGDTLRDGVEKNTGVFVDANDTGTNPLDRDTDDDGFMDHVEIARSTNPTQAGSHPPTDPVVSLDAAGLPPGALNTWTNLGSIGGNFVAENGSGIVQTVQGVNSVNMPGPITTGPSYAGPAPSPWLFGNNSYSVEAWIHNPAAANEETIFSWGRRGANGQNASFNHGLSDDFGAMGHWGGQDLGWGPDANVKQGAWTHVVYIYDAAAGVQRCYSDGVQANTENIGPLAIDNLGANNVVLPFRIAAQTENAGTPTADFRGTLAISELRVFEFPLSEATISTNFNAGLDKYGLIDYDSDGLPTWYERQYSFLNETNANDATLDFDMDGVTNRDEYNPDFSAAKPWRTLPDVSDTDGDGISDGDEISGLGGTRSVTNPVNADTDWDGVPDAREFALGTNPLSSQDSDGDGFIEWVEVLYGSNPTNAASLPATNTPLPIVNLDATALPTGSLTTWHSSNALAYAFTAAGTGTVQFVAGTKGVTFAGSDWYNGPGMPQSMGANSSRTVEAWIFNPAVAGEETVFAWGRRGGPDGSNSAFSHGTDLAFGALQFWGAGPDVPWGLNAASIATNAVAGQWTFVTYTYDNVTGIRAAYKDGVLVNSETNAVGTVLNTHVFDPSDPGNTIPNQTPLGRTLAFRVGAQNDAAGSPSAPFASMTIAKLRAYDVALSAAQIAANFNAERAAFPGQPIIRNVSVNPANGFISFDWTPAPGRTYSVEANNSVVNPGGWSTIASNLNSGSFTNDPGGAPSRFYRLRLE